MLQPTLLCQRRIVTIQQYKSGKEPYQEGDAQTDTHPPMQPHQIVPDRHGITLKRIWTHGVLRPIQFSFPPIFHAWRRKNKGSGKRSPLSCAPVGSGYWAPQLRGCGAESCVRTLSTG